MGPRTQRSKFIYKYKDFNNKGAEGANLLDKNKAHNFWRKGPLFPLFCLQSHYYY